MMVPDGKRSDDSREPVPTTSNDGTIILIAEAYPMEIAPEGRKVDPSTIPWPEGIPKPWEENNPDQPMGGGNLR